MKAEREIIAQAIYEAPGYSTPWAGLSAEKQGPWLEDADRAISGLVKSGFILKKLSTRKHNRRCTLDLPDCPGNCGCYGCGA